MTQSCPSSEELHNLVGGTLSDLEAQPLELHLDECETCQQALHEIAAGETFWTAATTRLGDEKVAEPELDRVMETLQQQSLAEAEEIGEAIELKLSFIEPAVEPGTIGRLRHYDILRVAGRGGMGIVLKAFDRSLRRIVAVKLLAPHLAGNGQARQRFVREGRAAAGICHEHVVTIYAVEESPPFLVMQYVHGETLEERIHRTGSLPAHEAVRIALQIAQGLSAAHAQGVVHRDIKPGNILLENGVGRVRITDFGLARAIDDASMTQSGVVAGTPQYMAPEQACGDAIDERADLFSLGSVLYTMLAGHAPFRATTAMGVLKRLCDNAARPIREINPETPEWLAVVLNRLHAKNAADRFHIADEVVSLLQRGMASLQTGTAPPNVEPDAESPAASAAVAPVVSETTHSFNGSWKPEKPAEKHDSGGIFSAALMDVRTLFSRILPTRPLPLLFFVLAVMTLPFVPTAAALSAGIAFVAMVVPKLLPSISAKLFSEPTYDKLKSGSDDAAAATKPHWLLGMDWKYLFFWLVLWPLPILIWANVFYVQADLMRTARCADEVVEGNRLMALTAIVIVAIWTGVAALWFFRRSREGSRIFGPATRNKGILTIVGLAAVFVTCGIGTWESDVSSHVQYLYRAEITRPVVSRASIPTQQVQLEFEEPRDNMIVTIDTDGEPFEYWAVDGEQTTSVSAGPSTYPWRATLGQAEFASGEVHFSAGMTATIQVPRPRLIDLISGRWEPESSGNGSAGLSPMGGSATASNFETYEFEFNGANATFLDDRQLGQSRMNWEYQIDESVNPALITFTNSKGEKLAGIIQFETSQSSAGYGGMMPMGGMGSYEDYGSGMGGGGYEDGGSVSTRMKDGLLICLSGGQSLRPWQFKADPARQTELFILKRSKAPESLRDLVALTPLNVASTSSEIQDSVDAWSRKLGIPADRQNSIGIDLTLIPPAYFDLSSAYKSPVRNPILPMHPSDMLPDNTVDLSGSVPYPFVISCDTISKTQFETFVKETGYLTSAEEDADEVSVIAEEATQDSSPFDQALSLFDKNGGWIQEGELPAWKPGLSWKTSEQESSADERATVLSMRDATAFCEWLSRKENRQYRLPTTQEWTVAVELSRFRKRDDRDEATAEQTSPSRETETPKLLLGEWTADSAQILNQKCHVVAHRTVIGGERICQQSLALDQFRSSEIGFRVVTELQSAASRDSESRKQQPQFEFPQTE